jgi:threonine dehydratase
VTFADVERAARAIAGAVAVTDCSHSRTLSALHGADIWLKFENLQFTSSFKERGALNRLLALSEAERRRGVIAMSAGNHAQGVAYHAGRLGIPATIVMPEGTSELKIANTKVLGAEVILEGRTLEDAAAFAAGYGVERRLVLIHPFNDPLVIAGQGTAALEMLRAVPDLEVLVVPVGGGGLISGMGIAAKALKPAVEVIGVEAALYPPMHNFLKGTSLPAGGDTLAEGIAIKAPGELTQTIARRVVDDIILVSEPQIERAVYDLLMIEKTVVEGAGAVGLAALMAEPSRFKSRKVGLVLTGGNIDARLLTSVLLRELARGGRLARLVIDIPDRPGELGRVAAAIGAAGANIVEVYHQRVFTDLPARGTTLNLVVETRGQEHLDAVVSSLKGAGFGVTVKARSAAPKPDRNAEPL